MTKRIEMEIRSSSYSKVKFNEFIQKNLRSKYETINKERINSHNKRERNFNSNSPTNLDEKFRNFVIPRCTKLVDEYTYLQKYLLLNDIDFMSKEESYLLTVSIENYKKPVSWVNALRDSPDSYNKSIKSAKSVGKFSV